MALVLTAASGGSFARSEAAAAPAAQRAVAPASDPDDDGWCEDFSYRYAPRGAPRFADYRVGPQHFKPAPVKITGDLRGYRTMIRRGAAEGPNFAGHFTFAAWDMAWGQRCWVIIETATGAIRASDTGSQGVCATLQTVDGQEPAFRLDSRLLI